MRKARFHEPSLVPLADMLTNTVGIVVFILIFTVLTAGGVVVTKRLPMERTSDTKPVTFVCAEGHLLPLPIDDDFVDRFLEPLGKPKSYNDVDRWIKGFNAHILENQYFVAKGEGEANYTESALGTKSVRLALVLAFMPKAGAGDTVDDLERASSTLLRTLAKYSPSERFAYFIVTDDCIDVFVKARQIAMARLGYGYGWRPAKRDEPVRVVISGRGGYTPNPQ